MSSELLANANRVISDIDQVIQSFVLEEAASNDGRCEVERVTHSPPPPLPESYQDLDDCSGGPRHLDECSGGPQHLDECSGGPQQVYFPGETYTEQLSGGGGGVWHGIVGCPKGGEQEGRPVWEERWFEQAALIGRAMAEDRLHETVNEETTETPLDNPEISVEEGTKEERIPTMKCANREKRSKRSSPKEIREKISREKRTEFACKHCRATFKTSQQRWYHCRVEHEQVQLQCTECSKIFPKLQHLEVHLRSHLKIKPFLCPVEGCGKSFLTMQHCRSHQLVHSGEKMFECQVCGKRFRERNTLKRHSRTHSKMKDYSCEVCFKRFSYATSLRVHRKHFHAGVTDSTSKESQ